MGRNWWLALSKSISGNYRSYYNTLSLKSPLGIATTTNSQEYYESKEAEGEATVAQVNHVIKRRMSL